MKYIKLLTIVLLVLILKTDITLGQVIIIPTSPNVPFFNFDQLLRFQLVNTSNTDLLGVVQIQIEDNFSNSILQITSLPLQIKMSGSINHHQVNWGGGIKLGENQFARWMAQSGNLPNSQYVYCYRFLEVNSSRSLGTYCQENSTINFRPPELIYPLDKSIVPTPFPILSWRPPIPLIGSQLYYSLKLVELHEGQSTITAINSNLPLFEKYHLKTLSLPYPLTAISLEASKEYTWQITAYWGDVEIGKTDIWTFSIKEEDIKIEEEKFESFRFVKKNLDGNAYLFTDKLYFAYDNRSYEQTLNYSIISKGNEQQKIENLPVVNLSPGLNQITLATKGEIKLKSSQEYILRITDKHNSEYFLEFKYEPKIK